MKQQDRPTPSSGPVELDEEQLATIDAGIGMLLPAVQSAREAARAATFGQASLTTPRETASGA